jgi:hypothetical protein
MMSEDRKAFVDRDPESGIKIDFDPLQGEADLEERVRSGELTREQADELLQSAARRHTAEHGPDLDTDEEGLITQAGFGSGQGMDSHSSKSGKQS